MKFGHLVKYNGVYYPAGTEIPIEETKGGGNAPAPVVSGKVDEPQQDAVKERKYSEEDLKIPYMKLKALAKKEGFKVDNKAKAEEIRDMLRSL